MTIAKVEVERFSLTCVKPLDAIAAALKRATYLLPARSTALG